MTRSSFPGANFNIFFLNFCFYPAAEFTSGHLLAPWRRDIKEALESGVVSIGSPDASPQEAFRLHRYSIAELLSLFALR